MERLKLLGVVLLLAVSIAAPVLAASADAAEEEFHEEIFVRPLASGHVNTYFQFTTRWRYGDRSQLYNTRLIPRPIAEILQHFDLKELHISLTQGLWRYETWGYPVVDTAPGAEMWAWFGAPNLTAEQVDAQWLNVASTFSGILCASLNFIDRTNTNEPKFSFRPQFSMGKNGGKVPKFVRYATLPRENVCTENLTPWKKLLPCNSREGFASLLNSGNVHNTNFHSLGLRVRTLCEDYETNCVLEFTEFANLVYDQKLISSNSDFSLRRLFGQGLNGFCPLAETSRIYVSLEDDRYVLTPQPFTNTTSRRGGTTTTYGIYDMQTFTEDQFFNVAWTWRKDAAQGVIISPPPPLYAHRYILGYGQERGKIVTEITNNYYEPLPIVLQENIPWFVPSYLHTLKVVLMSNAPLDEQRQIEPRFLHFVPGVQRTRPYNLEMGLELPPQSTVRVFFDFDYIFLKWLEYPPDANHGHYIGSAVISAELPMARNYTAIPLEGLLFADSFNASRPAYFLSVRTETLVLSLPTPDFSMPYNVICLACTVVALAFGPIHSIATKKIGIEAFDSEQKSLFGKIKTRLFPRKSNAEKAPEEAESMASEGEELTGKPDAEEELHEKAE